MTEHLEAWEKALRAGTSTRRPMSENTVLVYVPKVKAFLLWTDGEPVTPALLYRYVSHLQRDLRQRPRTIHQAFAALFSFFGWLEETGRAKDLPSRKAVRLPPLDESTRYVPTPAEVEALWTATERLPARTRHQQFTRQRMLTILAALRYAGLRNFELRALNVSDIRMDELRLYVACGKGGKSDWLPIIAPLQEQLRLWLPLREGWIREKEKEGVAADVRQALFPTDRHNRLGEGSLRNLFRELCRRAFGDEAKLTPHCLRHAFGSTLHKLGVPDVYLARLCRHANVSITHAFYTHTEPEALAAFAERLGRPEIQVSPPQEQTVSEGRERRRPQRHKPGTNRRGARSR